MFQRRSLRLFLLIIILSGVVVAIAYTAAMMSASNIMVVFEPCDIDRDRDCDAEDYQLAQDALGQCIGGENYNEIADANHDGCVTSTDLHTLFPDVSR